MRAPGTNWTSSGAADGSAPRSRDASNGTGPRAGSAEGSPARSPLRWSDGSGGAEPGCGSPGMSGWKSSATDRGASVPDAELGAALSIGRSVTSGPFAIRTLGTRPGGLRRIGSWTVLAPDGGEFLCSGYVTGPRRDDWSGTGALRGAFG